MFDWFDNSAQSDPGCGIAETFYAIDIEVEDGATLALGSSNVYYTGTVDTHTTGIITGNQPILLKPTSYGDFNGNLVLDDDPLGNDYDVERFNTGYCTDFGDVDYDPLVDWNCDGLINCHDRRHLVDNWGTITGLVGESCALNNCP